MINNKYNISDYVIYLNESTEKDKHHFGETRIGVIKKVSLCKKGIYYKIYHSKDEEYEVIENRIFGIENKKAYEDLNSDNVDKRRNLGKKLDNIWDNIRKIRNEHEELLEKSKKEILLLLINKIELTLKKEGLIIKENNKKE